MLAHYIIPKDVIKDSSPRTKDLTVTGELSIHDPQNRPTVLFTSNLLPGQPNIEMMAETATYLATTHGFIVLFEFNGSDYYVYPHQNPLDIIRKYYEQYWNTCLRKRINDFETAVYNLKQGEE